MKLRYYLFVLLLLPQIANADCWDKTQVIATQLEEIVRAHETAKQALVTIRRNAQDWKNLLLRGNIEKDKEVLLKRFEEQKTAYQKELIKLKSELLVINKGADMLDILEAENKKLFTQYKEAYQKYGVETLNAAALADRQVQGGDVLTFRTLEKLDNQLSDLIKEKFRELKVSINACIK